MRKQKIVFIGSHLAKQRGTKGISEKIVGLMGKEYDISLVSGYENKVLRLVDIVWTLIMKRFDIVHIDVFSNKGFIYADIASKIASIKNEQVVMTLRGGMLTEKYEREPQRVRTVLQRADVLQSPSLFLIEFFQQQGIEVEYMPNFIDMSHFPYARNNVKPYSLLWVRAFSTEYRPELAVATLHKLLKRYPDTTLTMVGPDKGTKGETERLVKELGIEKQVVFEGRVANEELLHYYQSHAVYLNTTAYESFGVALIEAASCGIPIVSTKVGEVPYMWSENEEILLIEGEDSSKMAEKVSQLFDDQKLAESFSLNARNKAENFSWSNIKPQWQSLFEEVMKSEADEK